MSRLRKLVKSVLPAPVAKRISVMARGIGTANAVGEASVRPSVPRLIEALWSGGSPTARGELEAVARSAAIEDRVSALTALGKWCMTAGKWQEAVGYFDDAAASSISLATEAISLAADCHLMLGNPRNAMARLAVLLDRRKPDPSTELRLGAIRSLEVGDLAPLVSSLNRIYVARGLAPLRRRDPTRATGWDNLDHGAPRFEPAEASFRVSVVIPVDAGDEFLPMARDSLRRQTWPDIEVVVAASGEIHLEDDGDLVVVRADRGSPRDAGVAAASGDVVLVHAPNEISHPQRVELQVVSLGEHRPLVGVHGTSLDIRGVPLPGSGIPTGELIRPMKSSLAWRGELPSTGDARFVADGVPMALVVTHSDLAVSSQGVV